MPPLLLIVQVCWAGPHTLALAGSQDTVVRLLQLDTDDNYVLDLKPREFSRSSSSAGRPASVAADTGIVSIVYERTQQVLAAATAGGQVCLFKRWLPSTMAGTTAAADPASQWQPSHCFWVSALHQLSTVQKTSANCVRC